MLLVSKLRNPATLKQAFDVVIELLKSLGFQTTGWQDGRIQKTLVTLHAALLADSTEIARSIVEFGFNDLATGDALTEFSRSRFDNERTPAKRTKGKLRLTSTASIPYTIEPGQLIAATDTNTQFRCIEGGTLPAGSVASPSSIALDFEAVLAGSAGNVANSTITRLLTPLAGVTITNNESAPWYTVSGADEETDASLRARNRTKWARLSVELVADAYENIARSFTGVEKVAVVDNNPRGPGTLDVYVAPQLGVFSSSDLAEIQSYFAPRVLQTSSFYPPAPRSRVAVKSPTVQPLNITATIYHDPNVEPADLDPLVQQALNDFLRETPIGGWSFATGAEHVVLHEDISDRIKEVDGVRAVKMVVPSSTVSVGPLYLVTQGTWTFTYVKAVE